MKKITDLLKDIAEYPYTGIGKPEPLKYELAGYWSRRINSEHRIIYSVHDDIVTNILNFYEISTYSGAYSFTFRQLIRA